MSVSRAMRNLFRARSPVRGGVVLVTVASVPRSPRTLTFLDHLSDMVTKRQTGFLTGEPREQGSLDCAAGDSPTVRTESLPP
jgi:hypothetical protein